MGVLRQQWSWVVYALYMCHCTLGLTTLLPAYLASPLCSPPSPLLSLPHPSQSPLTLTLPPSSLTVTPHPLCMTWSRSTCSSTNPTQRCTGRRAMHCTTWQRGARGRVSAIWPTASQHGSSMPAPPLLCNTTRKVWPLFDTSTLVSMSGRHSSPTAQLIHTVHLCACVHGLACLLL